MSHDIVITKDSSYGDSLAEKFHSLKENNIFTDCTVIILEGDEEVCKLKVHANIMSAFSLYFNKMWGSEMQEGITRTCRIGRFEPDLMKKMIDYIYTGSITIAVSDFDQAKQLCEYWQIPKFKDVFEDEFSDTMTVDNALRRLMAAQQYGITELVRLARDFTSSWFTEVTSSSEFVQLEVESLEQFLQDCPAMDISTDDKLMAVERWIKHDMQSRCSNKKATGYFEYYLPYCSQKLLNSLTLPSRRRFLVLTKLDVCVDDALREKDLNLSHQQRKIADLYPIVFCDIAFGKCLKLKRERLTEFHRFETELFVHYSVCQCYGVGLILSGGRGRSCKLFNLLTENCTDLANLKTERNKHASVCINGELFVIGGNTKASQTTAECLIVDIPNSKFNQLPDVPLEGLSDPQIAHVDHNIYVAGSNSNRFMKFDVRGREWSELDTICGERRILTLAAGGGNIYAVGSMAAAMYSIATGRWTKIRKPINHAHLSFVTSVFHDDRLFILPGGDRTWCPPFEEYDVKTDEWSKAYVNPNGCNHVTAFSMTCPTEPDMSPKDDAQPHMYTESILCVLL